MKSFTFRRWSAALAALALTAAACSSQADSAVGSAQSSPAAVSSAASGAPAPAPGSGGEVVLVTHDSFAMDQAVIDTFSTSTGIKLTVLAQGDAGSMVNKLVLTKDNPIGDVAFGIDNTFASRALDSGVLAAYQSPLASNGSDAFAIDPEHRLTAVDYGDVCINVDHTWFAAKKLAEPRTYEDLAKPEYKDLLVVPSPATSSPGLAFLLGTIAHFGTNNDPWQNYWKQLVANGIKVTSGWEDAYTVDFSGSSGKGDRPLVLSYASSPPFEVADGQTQAPTGALLDTCFRQVEYAGVLAGAKNPQGAQRVIDFLLSPEFQAALPEQMYVYPVDPKTTLPQSWSTFAPAATDPATVDPAEITKHREQWIDAWTEVVEG